MTSEHLNRAQWYTGHDQVRTERMPEDMQVEMKKGTAEGIKKQLGLKE